MLMETMSTRLGRILSGVRGDETRAKFARRLEFSYTYVRALELGLRSPSDGVLVEIAHKLKLDPGDLLIAAYCDRSPRLTDALVARGIVQRESPSEASEEPAPSQAPRKSKSLSAEVSTKT